MGFIGVRADFSHLLANLICVEHCTRQRSERARLRRRDRQLAIHRAGNGGLHDGQFDLEQFEETLVGPHHCTIVGNQMPELFTL